MSDEYAKPPFEITIKIYNPETGEYDPIDERSTVEIKPRTGGAVIHTTVFPADTVTTITTSDGKTVYDSTTIARRASTFWKPAPLITVEFDITPEFKAALWRLISWRAAWERALARRRAENESRN